MKAQIVVTGEDGTVWTGEVTLTAGAGRSRPHTRGAEDPPHEAQASSFKSADLKLPARAFFRKFSSATAAAKFALVVAHIAQGAVGKEVSGSEIAKVWSQNSGVLGGPYQTMYGTRSKEKGWVDSKKRGVFVLVDGWQQAANG